MAHSYIDHRALISLHNNTLHSIIHIKINTTTQTNYHFYIQPSQATKPLPRILVGTMYAKYGVPALPSRLANWHITSEGYVIAYGTICVQVYIQKETKTAYFVGRYVGGLRYHNHACRMTKRGIIEYVDALCDH